MLQLDEPKVEEKSQITATETSKSNVNEDLPEWLGGPKVSKDQKQGTEKTSRSEVTSVKSTELVTRTSNSLETPVNMAGQNIYQNNP